MGTKTKFLRQFFKDRQMVGAVAPSTRFLAEKMLKNVDFKHSRLIIELGPGNGVITEIMLERMAPDAKLYVFELNDEFHKQVTALINDPRVQVIHDSAENIANYIDQEGIADTVISSLPLMVFPEKMRANVVSTVYKTLHSRGKFIQFQYSLQSKRYLEGVFKNVNTEFTVRNLPPAFIYTCQK